MAKRWLCLALLVLIVGSNSGCRCICCLHDNLLALYKSRRWADCGCGPVYYGPWIDTPPDCCDPCNCVGQFTGQRKYWSPGPQQWRQQGGNSNGGNMMMDGTEGIPAGQSMPEGVFPGDPVPTPADPPANAPQRTAPPPAPAPRVGRRPRPRPQQAANPYQTSSSAPADRSPW